MNEGLKQLVVEEYMYMDGKSRLQQIRKAIEHGPHSMDLVFEKDSREGVLAVRERGSGADPVVVRLEGKDDIAIDDPGSPLTAVVRTSLSKNNMLEEGRITPRSAIHYFGEDEREEDEETLDEQQILEILENNPYRFSFETHQEPRPDQGIYGGRFIYSFQTEAGTEYYVALTYSPSNVDPDKYIGDFEFGTESGGKTDVTGERDVTRVVSTAFAALSDAVKRAPELTMIDVGGSGGQEMSEKRVRIYKRFIDKNYSQLDIESSRRGFDINNPEALA